MKTHARYFFRAMIRHFRKRGWIWLSVVLALELFSHRYHFELNLTESLPQTLFLVDKKDQAIRKGDYVAFYPPRAATGGYRLPFIKEVMCSPGQTVEVSENREYSCGAGVFAKAKLYSLEGHPLEAAPSMTLGPYEWFVRGTHPDSYDSRYKVFGPVTDIQIIGKAYPIF